jgi:protein-tyrosine sulfotransferase
MSAYATSRGKRLWCEKSVDNLACLSSLKNVFPDARYICLYRNCMDTVHSLFERSLGTSPRVSPSCHPYDKNEVCLYVNHWIHDTGLLLAFEQENADRCIRVRYEDLVIAPAGILKPVFEFLGLEWDVNILDSVFLTQHTAGPGDLKVMFTREIHQKSLGKGSAISRQCITEDLLQKMNSTLERLAYPPVGPDWDETPSPYNNAQLQSGQGRAITDASELFANLFPQRLRARPELLDQTKSVCKFVVAGEREYHWTIDLNGTEACLRSDNGEADCTITIMQNDLIKMVNGDLNPGEAFLQGRVRIAGDLALAMAVGHLLFVPPPNL